MSYADVRTYDGNYSIRCSAIFNRSHGDIHVYLEFLQRFVERFCSPVLASEVFLQNAFASTKEES